MEQIARDAQELKRVSARLTMIGMNSPQIDAMLRAGTASGADIAALKSRGPARRGTAGAIQARRDAMLDELAERLDAVVSPKLAAA